MMHEHTNIKCYIMLTSK